MNNNTINKKKKCAKCLSTEHADFSNAARADPIKYHSTEARRLLEVTIHGLESNGIAAGCHADLVLLQASDPVEAIRLRATRLRVYRRGTLIAQAPANTSTLHLPGRPASTAFRHDSIPRF